MSGNNGAGTPAPRRDSSAELPILPSEDALFVMQAIDQHGPDADFTVIKRDNRIVNVTVAQQLRKELERRKVREVGT